MFQYISDNLKKSITKDRRKMYLSRNLRSSLLFCAVYFLFSIGQTSYHRDFLKNLIAWNRTEERMSMGKITCSSGEIVKPHLDLYVEKKKIHLKIKVFQHPIDNTINILFDNTTIDVTRFVNNTCYNVDGKCSNTICSCDASNKSFTAIYRTAFLRNCITIGIEYRFANGSDGEIIKVISFRKYDGLDFGRLHIQIASLTKCNEDVECADCFSMFTGFFVLCTIIVVILLVLVKNPDFRIKKLTQTIDYYKKIAAARVRVDIQELQNYFRRKCKMKEIMLQRDGLYSEPLISFTKLPKPKDVVNDVDNDSCKLQSWKEYEQVLPVFHISPENCRASCFQ